MLISYLNEDSVVHIMTFFRAIELAAIMEVNKTVFCQRRVELAVQRIIYESGISPKNKSLKLVQEQIWTPAALFVFEVTSLQFAITSTIPLPGKGTI
jgi:hypothetical protein